MVSERVFVISLARFGVSDGRCVVVVVVSEG